jgi:hypothetical protein
MTNARPPLRVAPGEADTYKVALLERDAVLRRA